jgi:hypothetical protein
MGSKAIGIVIGKERDIEKKREEKRPDGSAFVAISRR